MRSAVLRVLALVALACLVAAVDARHHRLHLRTTHKSTPAVTTTPNAGPRQGVNLRPIIGIFSLAGSDNDNETTSSISAAYVKWLEQGGARVAVVPFNAPHDVLDKLFDGINGLLFTGGGLSLAADTLYYKQATYLFNKAMAANDAGDFFPIWGTCQGFQLLNLLAAQPANHHDVLKCEIYNSTNLPLPLDFTDAAPTSQLYGPAQLIPAIFDGSGMHPTMYEVLATQAITMNLHNCGVSPKDFAANPTLPNFYSVLSTNVDLNNLPFISSIEGIKYPFWATQWHPERTQFEWDIGEKLAKDAQSIAVHSYVAQRLIMNVRKSTHSFPTEADAEAALIYNYTPTYTLHQPGCTFCAEQTYYFNFVFPSAQQ